MGPLARTGLAGVLSCGVLIAVVSIERADKGDGKSRAPAPTAVVQGPYVALGDSYTSGPGIPDQTGKPAGCDRSSRNYPALVAKRLGVKAADFRDMSCSGATTTDLTAPQSTDDGTNPAQLSVLDRRTRLVTLGIGGNDIGFSSMITKCVTAGALYKAAAQLASVPDQAPCKGSYQSGGTDTVTEKIDATRQRLDRALREVHERAPQARVYVVGYPSILPSDASACDRAIPLAPGDVTFLRDQEGRLNTMLRERAEAAGATYVDTHTPSAGRDACSPAGTRWIEPLEPASPAARVHPNARGEQGMAEAVLKSIGA
ncbi:GDSL-type esterase/lipase family protein [Streptomyces sp. NPDC008092]|uniref:SGNH/GDSL hydrolase family protein n=1 Tax=Streptomyces sp. NPDC008092 TaxID=3364808 RepID=UPI0036E4C52C